MSPSPSPRTLLAARHAPTGLDGLCVGDSDVPTLLGADEAAARLLGPARDHGIEVVWSSPLRRCAEVATRLAAALGARLCLDDRLRELSFGQWQGRAWSEIAAREPVAWRRWVDGWRTEAPPGGERLHAFEARVAAWWRALSTAETPFLVAHAGVVRGLRVIAGGARWEDALGGPVPHLALERFRLPAGAPPAAAGEGR